MKNTQHKSGCKMAFGRKDATCPRCQELLKGAPTRSGWQQDYYKQKAQNDRIWQLRLAEMHRPGHTFNPGGYCITPGCGRCGGDFS